MEQNSAFLLQRDTTQVSLGPSRTTNSHRCHVDSVNDVKVKIIRDKAKAIPVKGRGGPYRCEASRLPHFLDNRLTDGDDVSLTRRPPFIPRKIPRTHF
jgi:hypothetical protein